MVVYPNAKINLGLNITEKRPDGYHNIESVFLPIQLCDTLSIIENPKFEFIQSGIKLDSEPENNLVVKAFRILEREFKLPPVSIQLEKNIPFGGGLGGGSSDASFCLKAVNSLFDLNINDDKLAEYSKKIGADCPFFIYNKPSLVKGIGDIITPIDINLNDYILVLVKPDFGVPTPLAYKNIQPQKSAYPINEVISKPIELWKNKLSNDFEFSVFKLFPELKEIKEKLYSLGAVYASMSGSGATMFGLFRGNQNVKNEFSNYFVFQENIQI